MVTHCHEMISHMINISHSIRVEMLYQNKKWPFANASIAKTQPVHTPFEDGMQ